MTAVPSITLNNGVQMPALGLGVFQTPPEETTAAVAGGAAGRVPHVDTAAAYANERGVGEALRQSSLDRSEVFVETKVWISDYGYDETLHAFDKSAGKLGVDQIDLLILHQALPVGVPERRSTPTARSRRCSPTARFARSASATSCSTTSMRCSSTRRRWCRRSTRSRFTRTSRQRDVQARNAEHRSSRRRGRRSAASPSTATAPTAAPCRTRPSARSPRRTARRPPRSCCAGTSSRAARSSRSRPRPSRIAENIDVFDFELTDRGACARSTRSTPPSRRPRARRHHPRDLRTDHPRSLTAPAPTAATHPRPKHHPR